MTKESRTWVTPTVSPPWLTQYPPAINPAPTLKHGSIIEAWNDRVAMNPDRPAVRYFGGSLTAQSLDNHTDALAAELQDRGVKRGDRVGVYLQNVPHYPIALLAIWKTGGIAVPINPMYRGRELRRLIDDSGTTGMFVTRGSDADVREYLRGGKVRWLLSASSDDFKEDGPAGEDAAAPSPDGDVGEILARRAGGRPEPVAVELDATAFITYTSGTTGPPKGALNTHRNFLHAVLNYAAWVQLEPGDVVFAIAPLFHITGLSLNAGIALLNDVTLSMAGRFDARTVLDALRDHRVTTTIGSITAFNALSQHPRADRTHFASIRGLWSGGAPIPPATIANFRDRFGHYLHNIWGMTETTGGGIAVPPGADAPIHEPTGTLSIGIPMQNVDVYTVDAEGERQPLGEEGELVFSAPQVIPGYWQNAAATESTLAGGKLRTGDVAVIDAEGWVYLVDRLKDQINTSGFKVWPREVEDVLYEHPAVFESAVIGVPDDYRGETVVAYVSLRADASTTAGELIAFARERLAPYKCPREVNILDGLPKTATGKIQRAQLRDRVRTPSPPTREEP